MKPNWLLSGADKDGESITKEWQPASLRTIHGVQTREVKPVLTAYGHLTEVLRAEWLPENDRVDQIFASTLLPGGLSAWHAHAQTTDRLFVVAGCARVVLYDNREDSPTRGLVNEFRLADLRPRLLVIPPRVWHGVQNYGTANMVLLNAVDLAYRYEDPDHWRVPHDSTEVPYTFPSVRALQA